MSGSSQTFDIVTMGCKVNTYDTGLLEKQLSSQGFNRSSQNPKYLILNSCAVTEKSTLDAHKEVQRFKRKNPEQVVVITGCVAQVDVDRLRLLSGADLVVGNSHKSQLAEILNKYQKQDSPQVFHSNIFKLEELGEGGGLESGHSRAFLKIQDGCNSFCAFCIIPYARGKSRSLDKDQLIKMVHSFEDQGIREVVLTGVHCADYSSGELDFAGLVGAVLEQTKIPRVRLSSLEPTEVTDALWELFKKYPERLCRHLHVSLQSANTKVLKEMKRSYSQEDIRKFFEKFREVMPEGFIGMDIITGFPGETQAEFDDTLEFLINEPSWSKLHVFPYSSRPKTPAAKRSDHVDSSELAERASQLRQLSLFRTREKAALQVGMAKDCLVFSNPKQGLTRDYWHVEIQGGNESQIGQEIKVEITQAHQFRGGEPYLVGIIPTPHAK